MRDAVSTTNLVRRAIISANWKMHNTHFEAIQSVQKLSYLIGKDDVGEVDVVIHPPFTDIRSIQTLIEADHLPYALGAQHCHWEDNGAYTGEVSAVFLAKLGVHYVICGHSERRELFGEDDEVVAKKVVAIHRNAMTPILCVGETLAEREAGATLAVVQRHIEGGLANVTKEQIITVIIAYEPVWAIGTGKVATTEQAQEVHAYIRDLLTKLYGAPLAQKVRILYGGSMKPANAAELLAQKDIDGGLIGGASLEARSFIELVKAADAVK